MDTQTTQTTQTTELLSTIQFLDLIQPNYSILEEYGQKLNLRIVRITPKIASIILETNTSNRPKNKSNINFLAKEINSGNWRFDGESIKFDKNGNLLDGQHRLESVIKTNTPIITLVLYGLEPLVFTVLDTGKKRSGSDALGALGVENSTLVTSSIRLINQFNKGSYGEGGSIGRVLSNQEIVDFYYNNLTLNESAKFGVSLYKKSNGEITPSLIATFHFLLSKKDEKQAVDFLTKLCLGVNLEKSSPITALRNKLIRARLNKKYTMLQTEIVKNIIVAWNKYRKNEKVTRLNIHTSNDNIVIE